MSEKIVSSGKALGGGGDRPQRRLGVRAKGKNNKYKFAERNYTFKCVGTFVRN